MTDQTEDRLRLVIGGLRSDAERARKTAKRSKRDKLLWECRADMFDKDAAALSTLLADRERLRLAMKPFATVGRLIDRYFPKHGDAETFHSGAGWRDKDGNTKTLTLGDFRAAKAALNTQGEG